MSFKVDTSIKEIRKEVGHLVDIHSLDREQRIYSLSQFFSPGEWELVECEIEANGYSLMTNSINDLLEN
ncbi:MAG: DUF4327 family protein [Pleurocapsa sp. SU_5_0]|nr:DUF4327 family protein [Pleurocapsa sp. SU_5_0]NJO98481.1 DUF4327 family protein [Pleurocapsa sp. CRU_1_2]NJR47375.1 DUF4327 family protein [Hyellaceae cyanobacterium CSU_1_1]